MKKSMAVASRIALLGMALSSGSMHAGTEVVDTPGNTVYGAQSQNTQVFAPSAAGAAYGGGYGAYGGDRYNRHNGNEHRRSDGNRNGGGHHHARR